MSTSALWLPCASTRSFVTKGRSFSDDFEAGVGVGTGDPRGVPNGAGDRFLNDGLWLRLATGERFVLAA